MNSCSSFDMIQHYQYQQWPKKEWFYSKLEDNHTNHFNKGVSQKLALRKFTMWVEFTMNCNNSYPINDVNGLFIFQTNTLWGDQNFSHICSEHFFNSSGGVSFKNFRRHVINLLIIAHLKWNTSNMMEFHGIVLGYRPKWEIPKLCTSIQSICFFIE